ncbi:hypothetical protein LTR35_014523 [Friedmanniomyces endolithicus]|uniref:Zn(2)-C6 fungal-type domain-containing protein n=1 Tax=Friedmanniomyces endolithicus TaxID=329885 RepID=A0AAN6FHG0_9PEZI|nr:hypothetical protein LTR35_014523 [Friedmanniomyces endolithicus]KAK0273359.1 hypothetical protein LTS00_015841 [Friedmanniomyces endolithicus]KAK0316058.1 hypothetical protein LTR82_012351 [Friedmanniomyces endolithicus]KAK0985592.1 hypothetical protein LTR54_013669 [Friedmanniomyces endolithicus]
MPPPGTPASVHADQTFHFIHNEPNHKQNLSGRVTAACVNCRRKKIRCTGEAGCRQCRDKGLICEGPPSRRKAKRETVSTGAPAQVESSTRSISSTSTGNNISNPASRSSSLIYFGHASPRRESQVSLDSSTPAPPQRPLETEVTTPDRSLRPLPARRTLQHILPAWDRREHDVLPSAVVPEEPSPFAFTQQVTYLPGPITASPTTTSTSHWSQVSQGPPLDMSMAVRTVSGPSQWEQAPVSAVTVSSDSNEYSSHQYLDSLWPNKRLQHRSPERLIHDAEELEQQASSLRQLALRRRSLDTSARTSQEQMSQHQLIPPQPVKRRLSQQEQMMQHLALPSDPLDPTFSACPPEPPYASYNFDLSTMYQPDGTIDPALNPNPTGYGLWEVNTPQQRPPQPTWQIGTGHSIPAQFQPNFQQQDYPMPTVAPPPPPNTAYTASAHGSISSGSSTDGTGIARMQRAFYAQLAESEDRRGIGTHGRDRESGTKFPKR